MRRVERKADEVAQVVLVHAALREALVGMREHEAVELLDRLQHFAEASDRRGGLPSIEVPTSTALNPCSFTTRSSSAIAASGSCIGRCAMPRSRAGMLRHHLRDAVVRELRRFEPDLRRAASRNKIGGPTEIAAMSSWFAVHPLDLGVRVVERRLQLGQTVRGR